MATTTRCGDAQPRYSADRAGPRVVPARWCHEVYARPSAGGRPARTPPTSRCRRPCGPGRRRGGARRREDDRDAPRRAGLPGRARPRLGRPADLAGGAPPGADAVPNVSTAYPSDPSGSPGGAAAGRAGLAGGPGPAGAGARPGDAGVVAAGRRHARAAPGLADGAGLSRRHPRRSVGGPTGARSGARARVLRRPLEPVGGVAGVRRRRPDRARGDAVARVAAGPADDARRGGRGAARRTRRPGDPLSAGG